MSTDLKFGPTWVRKLCEPSPGSQSVTHTNDPPTGTSSSIRQSSSSNMQGAKYKLATYRYGKEDMLGLFPSPTKPPDYLIRDNPTLCSKVMQIPLGATFLTVEEEEIMRSGFNSECSLRVKGGGSSAHQSSNTISSSTASFPSSSLHSNKGSSAMEQASRDVTNRRPPPPMDGPGGLTRDTHGSMRGGLNGRTPDRRIIPGSEPVKVRPPPPGNLVQHQMSSSPRVMGRERSPTGPRDPALSDGRDFGFRRGNSLNEDVRPQRPNDRFLREPSTEEEGKGVARKTSQANNVDNWRDKMQTASTTNARDNWRNRDSWNSGPGGPNNTSSHINTKPSRSWREGQDDDPNGYRNGPRTNRHRDHWNDGSNDLPEWSVDDGTTAVGTFDADGIFVGDGDNGEDGGEEWHPVGRRGDRKTSLSDRHQMSNHNNNHHHREAESKSKREVVQVSSTVKDSLSSHLTTGPKTTESTTTHHRQLPQPVSRLPDPLIPTAAPAIVPVAAPKEGNETRNNLTQNTPQNHHPPNHHQLQQQQQQEQQLSTQSAQRQYISQHHQQQQQQISHQEGVSRSRNYSNDYEVLDDLEQVTKNIMNQLSVEDDEGALNRKASSHQPHRGTNNPHTRQPEIPPSEPTKWYYRDPHGKVQGPFNDEVMLDWHKSGYFVDTLQVRREVDETFVPLGYLTNEWDRIPFAPGPYMPPTRAEVNQPRPSQPVMNMYQQQQQQPHSSSQQNANYGEHIANQNQINPRSGWNLGQQQHQHQQQQQQQQPQQTQSSGSSFNGLQQPSQGSNFVVNNQQIMQFLLNDLKKSDEFMSLPLAQQEVILKQKIHEYSAHIQRQTQSIETFSRAPEPKPVSNSSLDLNRLLINSNPNQIGHQFMNGQAITAAQLEDEMRRDHEREQQMRLEDQKRRADEEVKRLKELQEEEKQRKLQELRMMEEERRMSQEKLRKQEEKRRQEDEEMRRYEEKMKMDEIATKLRAEQEKRIKEMEERNKLATKVQAEKMLKQQEAERKKMEMERIRQQKEQEMIRAKLSSQKGWGVGSTKGEGALLQSQLDLADIQRMQEEKETEERRMEEMKRQMAASIASKASNNPNNSASWNTKDASAPKKTLKEIQEEEARKVAIQKAKEAARAPVCSGNTGIWSNAASQLSWKGNNSGGNSSSSVLGIPGSNSQSSGWTVVGAPIPSGVQSKHTPKKQAPVPSSILSGPSLGQATSTLSHSSASSVTGTMTSVGFWDDDPVPVPPKPVVTKSSHALDSKSANSSASANKSKTRKEEVHKLFQKPSASSEFTLWCEENMKKFGGKLDIPTFIGFIKEIESPFDVADYCRDYLGESKESKDFIKQFLEKRSYFRDLEKKKSSDSEQMWGPAPAITPSAAKGSTVTEKEETFSQVKGKGRKKKGKKLIEVGFTVQADPDRIKGGEIDRYD